MTSMKKTESNAEGTYKHYFFPSPFLPGKSGKDWIDYCDDESDHCTPFPPFLKILCFFYL